MLKNILFKKYFKPHEYCECSTLSLSAILLFQQCGSYFSNVLFMEPCTFFKMRKWIQILYCKEVVPDLKKKHKRLGSVMVFFCISSWIKLSQSHTIITITMRWSPNRWRKYLPMYLPFPQRTLSCPSVYALSDVNRWLCHLAPVLCPGIWKNVF